MSSLIQAQQLIEKHCDRIKELLLGKNKKYGNSALEPLNVFSKLDPIEGIKLRIDDKLKRIKNVGARTGDGEKTDDDLIGYLILLQVSEELATAKAALPSAILHPTGVLECTTPGGGFTTIVGPGGMKVGVKIE